MISQKRSKYISTTEITSLKIRIISNSKKLIRWKRIGVKPLNDLYKINEKQQEIKTKSLGNIGLIGHIDALW